MSREFSQKTREEMRERAGNCCEICRLRPIGCFHHRLLRSQGGFGTLENGMALCSGPGSCHEWIHNNTGESYELGYLIEMQPVTTGLKARHLPAARVVPQRQGIGPSIDRRPR